MVCVEILTPTDIADYASGNADEELKASVEGALLQDEKARFALESALSRRGKRQEVTQTDRELLDELLAEIERAKSDFQSIGVNALRTNRNNLVGKEPELPTVYGICVARAEGCDTYQRRIGALRSPRAEAEADDKCRLPNRPIDALKVVDERLESSLHDAFESAESPAVALTLADVFDLWARDSIKLTYLDCQT